MSQKKTKRGDTTTDDRLLMEWLRNKHKLSERAAKLSGREGRYGDAQLAAGRAEAYAWTLMHVTSEAKNRAGRAAAGR
jgi:hypothetical protein